MRNIEHWFCPGCGEIDGPRAGMICHGPQMTGGCASVRNEVVEISHDAALRLAGAVGALEAIDREACVIVLNDEDAQARHQRIADLAHDALSTPGGGKGVPEHYEATGDALCGNVMLHARGASSIFAQTYNLAGAEKIAAALNDHQGAVALIRALGSGWRANDDEAISNALVALEDWAGLTEQGGR